MSEHPHSSAAARIAHAIATFLIAMIIFVFLVVMVPTVMNSVGGGGQIEDIEQTVPPDQLDSIRNLKTGGCGDPECVRLGREVPVTITVLNATGQQIFLDRVRFLLPLLLGFATVWILRNLIYSMTREPFVQANVTRLRKLGLLLLVGWPLVEVVNTFIGTVLADTTKTGSLGSDWNIPPAPEAIVAGLIVLVLAQVFAHGVDLREDVAGTV